VLLLNATSELRRASPACKYPTLPAATSQEGNSPWLHSAAQPLLISYRLGHGVTVTGPLPSESFFLSCHALVSCRAVLTWRHLALEEHQAEDTGRRRLAQHPDPAQKAPGTPVWFFATCRAPNARAVTSALLP